MKVFISADIEGVTGISNWAQTDEKSESYTIFKDRMHAEVNAAIQGAFSAGADDVIVRDAHGSATNLDIAKLDKRVRLISAFNDHPDGMMFGLDGTFDAVVLIGYHAGATMGGNPLAHTLSPGLIQKITINGETASEYLIDAYTAAAYGVPVVFASGDTRLKAHIEAHQEIFYVSTFEGHGRSVITNHPELTAEAIEQGVKDALLKKIRPIGLPQSFDVRITYKENLTAYKNAFYPGARLLDADTIGFQSDNYDDVKTFFAFTTL